MSLLDGIFQNKTLMNAALGKLGDVMKSQGLEYVIVSLDPEDGGILLKMAKPGDVTITENVPRETMDVPRETNQLPEPKTTENGNSQDRPTE